MTTVGSYCLVQDGIIDELFMFRKGRPGPLPAVEGAGKGGAPPAGRVGCFLSRSPLSAVARGGNRGTSRGERMP